MPKIAMIGAGSTVFAKNLMGDISRLSPIVQAAAFGAFLVLVDLLGPPGIAPFIYFQF